MATEHQTDAFKVLVSFGENHPTIRQWADQIETDAPGSERWSDDKLRGVAERLQAKELVSQYRDDGDGRQRYCVKGQEPPAAA